MTLLVIPEVVGPTTDADDINNLNEALIGDLVPRVDGTATDKGGNLGSVTYPFNKLYVSVAKLLVGSIKPFYDYAGTLDLPQGYMLCNGDQITPDAYNAQHRTDISDVTNYWQLYVSSSPLENLYLPNMNEKYLKGSASATQDGVSSITPVSTNSRDYSHSHGPTISSVSNPQRMASAASLWRVNTSTHTHDLSIDSGNGWLTQLGVVDIRPESLAVKMIMRIIQ